MHMSVYNNHFPKGYVCVCLLRPKSDRQRKVACNCSTNFKMLMSSAVPKKCLNSLWEQRISTFYLVEWYVKFQVKRNRSQYISSEISGYRIQWSKAKETMFSIRNERSLRNISWKTYWVLIFVELAYCNFLFRQVKFYWSIKWRSVRTKLRVQRSCDVQF